MTTLTLRIDRQKGNNASRGIKRSLIEVGKNTFKELSFQIFVYKHRKISIQIEQQIKIKVNNEARGV